MTRPIPIPEEHPTQPGLCPGLLGKHDELAAYRHWLWTGKGYGPEGALDLRTILTAYYDGGDAIPGLANQALDAVIMLDNLLPAGGINHRLAQLATKIAGFAEPLGAAKAREQTEAAVNLLAHLHSLTMMLMEASARCSRCADAGLPSCENL